MAMPSVLSANGGDDLLPGASAKRAEQIIAGTRNFPVAGAGLFHRSHYFCRSCRRHLRSLSPNTAFMERIYLTSVKKNQQEKTVCNCLLIFKEDIRASLADKRRNLLFLKTKRKQLERTRERAFLYISSNGL
jgi:hypothetical protein